MAEEDKKVASEPLYGATPPGPSTWQAAPSPIEGEGPKQPSPVTTNPLFGANPSAPGPAASPSHSSAPSIPRRTARLPLHHPSPLPAYLRRLGYVLSLILGSSAVIGGIWSMFILPLLHSSFSARRALVDQQKDRWAALVHGLREVKAGRLYESPPAAKRALELESTDGESQSEAEEARLTHHVDDPPQDQGSGLIPLSPVSSLSTSLATLVSALMSTSTTRTSLLSTLESYTSTLHRQVYIRSQPLASQRYGLGTLSANLARAGGGKSNRWPYDADQSADHADGGGLDSVGVRSEEWDAVRKEVRAIKGMLLSRRNFAPVDPTSAR